MRPVNKTEFWKERLDAAKKKGQLHESVFVTSPDQWKHIEEGHKKMVKQMVKGKVLDAGCGYGRMAEWIESDPKLSEVVTRYVGVDLSPDLIAEAKNQYPHLQYPKYEFKVGQLESLPYEDKEFDWAVCISIRGMVIRELGTDAWEKMKVELKRVARNVLILEYGEVNTSMLL